MDERPPHKLRRRKIKAAPEAYPEIDLDEADRLAEQFKDVDNDTEAIRIALGDPNLVAIVHQGAKGPRKKS